MRLTKTTLIMGIVMFCLQINGFSQEQSPDGDGSAPTPGFTEAVFDKATLENIMDDRDCTGIRFYNVLKESGGTEGTAIVIGLKADGSELNGGLFAKPYKRSDGVVGENVTIKGLSKNKAANGCTWISDAGHFNYCASFTKSEVTALLNQGGTDGLRITPTELNAGLTMTTTSYQYNRGTWGATGSGNDYEAVCSDPCPLACGEETNYVNR